MKYTARKYMGDDRYSWAVFRSEDIPKGHRGVVCNPNIRPVVSGLCSREARYQKDKLNTKEVK